MKIGNIVTNISIDIDDIFNIYSFDEINGVDHSIPTFYIGFIETRELFGKINPLERKLDDLHFWSFTKKENNKELNKDLFRFKIYCHKQYIEKYKYYYISPSLSLTNIKKYIDLIRTNLSEITIVKGKKDMLYLNYNDFIFGINLDMLNYMNINTWNLLNKLRLNSKKYVDYNSLDLNVKYFCDILESDMYACIVI